jgi:hypothetical protein
MCDRDPKPQFNSIPFWLLIAAFSLPFTTQNTLAADQGQPAVKERSQSVPDRITTLDGRTYDKVTLEKVEPDGLLVVFAPVEGGSGTAKLKFQNLPAELRERYGYDPARSSDYETARARGEATWSAENAVWAEQRRAAQAEEAIRERQLRAQSESRLAAETEQAAHNLEQPANYNHRSYWPAYPAPRHPKAPSQKNHTPQPITAAGITSSPISTIIGPMRPLGK